jgi:hypothetical protein
MYFGDQIELGKIVPVGLSVLLEKNLTALMHYHLLQQIGPCNHQFPAF